MVFLTATPLSNNMSAAVFGVHPNSMIDIDAPLMSSIEGGEHLTTVLKDLMSG